VKSVRQTALDVQHGDASALSVLEESLARIRARNEELNVFLYVDEEGARAAANAIDERVARGENVGALAGVPVALKDNLCQTNIPTTCSSKILEGWRPPTAPRSSIDSSSRAPSRSARPISMSSPWVRRLRTRLRSHPKPPRHVAGPGGSSGGSAAAVAADMTPLASVATPAARFVNRRRSVDSSA